MKPVKKQMYFAMLAILLLSMTPELSMAGTEPKAKTAEVPQNRSERYALARQFSNTAAFADQLPAPATANFLNMLQGRVPGLFIQEGWGPYAGASIRGSWRQPLLVVDGLPMHISGASTINVEDIAIIEVHKRAGATAWWGRRAAGGVIVVNTRR